MPNKTFGLFESIYGGHLSQGQKHLAAIERELLEELGLSNIKESLEGTLDFISFDVFEEPGENNKEVRSLFVYRLKNEEWANVQKEMEKLAGAR